MTTIVYDHKNKVIACDGQTSSGMRIDSYDTKKWVEKGGDVWFMAGAVADQDRAIKHLTAKDPDAPKWAINCGALLVRDGTVYRCGVEDDGEPWLAAVEYNDGVGSGSGWALAAMDFGLSAGDAVAYAATRDTETGGKITVYDIATGKFKKHKKRKS